MKELYSGFPAAMKSRLPMRVDRLRRARDRNLVRILDEHEPQFAPRTRAEVLEVRHALRVDLLQQALRLGLLHDLQIHVATSTSERPCAARSLATFCTEFPSTKFTLAPVRFSNGAP